MPAPTISLPTTGTSPKTATKAGLEGVVNDALETLHDDIQTRATDADLTTLEGEVDTAVADLADLDAGTAFVRARLGEVDATDDRLRIMDGAGIVFAEISPTGLRGSDFSIGPDAMQNSVVQFETLAGEDGVVFVDPLGFVIGRVGDSNDSGGAAAVSEPLSDGRNLRAWRAKLAQIAEGEAVTVRLMITGDSWTERQIIPQRIADLVYDHGRGGDGWMSPQSANANQTLNSVAFTKTGWTVVDMSEGGTGPFAHDGFRADATGASATMAWTDLTCGEIRLYYRDTTGTFRWRVNAGSWTSVAGGGTNAIAKVTVSGLSTAAVHDFEIDTTGNSGTVSIYGLWATGKTGVEVLKCGNSGAVASEYGDIAASAETAYIMADIAPDLTVITLGTNDYIVDVPLEDFKADCLLLAQATFTANPQASVLFLSPPRNDRPPGAFAMQQYAQTAIDLHGERSDIEYLDYTRLFGDWAAMDALGCWDDAAHLNENGARMFARLAWNHMLRVE